MASIAHIIRRRRTRRARQDIQREQGRLRLGAALAVLLVLVVLPVGAVLGSTVLTYRAAVQDLPVPGTAAPGAVGGLTEFYDRSGQVLLLADQSADVRWVTLAELPAGMLRATLRAEDPDFLEATSAPGLLSTVTRLWQNALYGPLAPDASLTARLVRTALLPPAGAPSAAQMSREIALIAEIERRYPPETILEWYLNSADYGNQLYGIQVAAQAYLGKDAAALSLDEAALLAAIPLAPQYNPLDNERAARGRQQDLLRSMRVAEDIDRDAYEIAAAQQTPILLTINRPDQIAPEFTAYARRQAQDILDQQGRDGARLVARGGLRIITALDLDLYQQIDCTASVLFGRLSGAGAAALAETPCPAANALAPGGALLGQAPDSATVVIIDAATGELRALYGQATRLALQPGPTLQPFVYFTSFISATANPATMVLDIPRTFPGSVEGLIYTPANPDNRFRGPLNLRDAMSAWLLPPAVQIARAQGLEVVLRRAHRIGLNSLGEDGRYDLSLLERGGAVSALDMAYAYSVFASEGLMRGVRTSSIGQGYRQLNPAAVLRIEDGEGQVIWQYEPDRVNDTAIRIFPAEVGYLVNDILADQTRRRQLLGDAAAVVGLDRPAAVVAGLTADRAENWTVGYTPQFVTAVHLARQDGAPLALDPNGFQGAAPLWAALTQYVHTRDRLPPTEWPRPDALIELNVCERSGLLPNDACPPRLEVFLAQPGFQPATQDSAWRNVLINVQTGQLASVSTPDELRASKLYFVPPPEAEDWWRANNLELPPTELDTISRPQLFNSVQLLAPQPYAYVGGVVDIRGSLDENDLQYYQLSFGRGQNPTEFFRIGEQQTSFTRGASLGSWDTTGLSGLYNILLTVVRTDGTAETAAVQVIVDNTPPVVALAAGEAGRIYRYPADDRIELLATVSDDYSIQRVEFYRGLEYLGADEEAPYGFTWRLTSAGDETFTAVAFDAVGNQAQNDVTVTVQRN